MPRPMVTFTREIAHSINPNRNNEQTERMEFLSYDRAGRHQLRTNAAFMAFLLVFSAVSLKLFPVPFVWIGCVFAVAAGLASFFFARSRLRPFLFNVAVISAVLVAAELYCWSFPSGDNARYEGNFTQGFNDLHDDVVGWRPLPLQRVTIRKYVDDVLVYDTVYTTDENGLRVSPVFHEGATPSRSVVLFFGCSFTFGVGVGDQETMPYLVGSGGNVPVKIFNFGVSGYGPHQMLAALQKGMVDEIIGDTVPDHVFYQAITGHVSRVAEMGWSVNHGPRYVLREDGTLVQDGYFDDLVRSRESNIFYRQVAKSYLFRFLLREYQIRKRVGTDEVKLFAAVVGAAQAEVQRRYPDCQFHVLLWDEPRNVLTGQIVNKMEEMGITLHRISEILPGWKEDEGQYHLHPADAHPNARAHALIARYVRGVIAADQ